MDLETVEKKLDIVFQNKDLLMEALTHRSYLNERPQWPHPHNERLEYLGDAVLELVVTEKLFHRFPEFPEGQLTMLRAALVNYMALALVAKHFMLERYILVSRGEAQDNGKAKDAIAANAVEALIGALYLDQGLESVRDFIEKHIMKRTDEVLRTKSYKDPKSELQEIVQERLKITPSYKLIEETGPAHQRLFKIGVYFGNESIAEGYGSSKQEGETEAARQALKKFQK